MHFTIYGTGAIGGSLGAYMVRAGEDVLFVDKSEEHVAQMKREGLKVDGYGGEVKVKVNAVLPEELPKALGIVLLAVKSQHTEEAVRHISKFLDEKSAVISLQNGLNEYAISQMIGPERTVGAFINWAADYLGPGYIKLGGKGSFYLGEVDGTMSPRIMDLARPLSALFPVNLTANIMGYLWSKQVDATVLFATALADMPIHEVVETPGMARVMGELVREAMQVPAALGVMLEKFDEFDPNLYRELRDTEAMGKIADQYRHNIKNKTGVWRDLAVRKRKTEVDGILGATLVQGEKCGIALPRLKRLIAMIHELEEGKRVMDIRNFKELGL
jgi:2-dehydropantoate 2-reductase